MDFFNTDNFRGGLHWNRNSHRPFPHAGTSRRGDLHITRRIFGTDDNTANRDTSLVLLLE